MGARGTFAFSFTGTRRSRPAASAAAQAGFPTHATPTEQGKSWKAEPDQWSYYYYYCSGTTGRAAPPSVETKGRFHGEVFFTQLVTSRARGRPWIAMRMRAAWHSVAHSERAPPRCALRPTWPRLPAAGRTLRRRSIRTPAGGPGGLPAGDDHVRDKSSRPWHGIEKACSGSPRAGMHSPPAIAAWWIGGSLFCAGADRAVVTAELVASMHVGSLRAIITATADAVGKHVDPQRRGQRATLNFPAGGRALLPQSLLTD